MPLTKEELTRLAISLARQSQPTTPLQSRHWLRQSPQSRPTKLSWQKLLPLTLAQKKTKREAVAAVHGEIVANALQGEALEAMFKSLGEAAPLGTNLCQNPP